MHAAKSAAYSGRCNLIWSSNSFESRVWTGLRLNVLQIFTAITLPRNPVKFVAIKNIAELSPQSGLNSPRIQTPPPSVCAEERKARRIRASDCLSEASLSSTPAGLSTAGCPQRSEGTQTVGSPFLLLTLLLAKQKKSESPAAATERHQDFAKYPALRSRTKTNSGPGVFGVGAQIPRAFGLPCGCFAAKL